MNYYVLGTILVGLWGLFLWYVMRLNRDAKDDKKIPKTLFYIVGGLGAVVVWLIPLKGIRKMD